VVTTNDLLINSSGFDVSGRGTLANLTNDSINFNLVANVDETPASDEQSYDIGGYSLPIACTGTFTSPTCLPDIQAIMVSAIQSAVQRGLTNLLERAAGGQTTQQQSPPVQETTDPAAERQQQEEARDPREELLKKALENLFQ